MRSSYSSTWRTYSLFTGLVILKCYPGDGIRDCLVLKMRFRIKFVIFDGMNCCKRCINFMILAFFLKQKLLSNEVKISKFIVHNIF